MTKKHFEWAAAYVRRNRAEKNADAYLDAAVEDAFVDLFREFNPHFRGDQFRAACRAEDYHDGRITHRYSKAS